MRVLGSLHRNRVRCGLAFTERFVLAVRRGAGKADRTFETSRRDLLPGLLSVSPVEANVRAASTLARLAGEALESVGCSGGDLGVLLPDLAVRVFVFAREERLSPQDLPARMAPRLAYPEEEIHFDTWQGPTGWTLAAAVRRGVVRQYEQAVEVVGFRPAWLDTPTLARIPGWAREARERGFYEEDGLWVHVQLYPGHYTLVIFRQAHLLDVRAKLRSAGDEPSVADYVARIGSWYGSEDFREISVRGQGASNLAEHIEARGISGRRIVRGEDGEEAHLVGSLGAVLGRW